VADREGNELHPFPILFEGRDEGGVFLGLLVDLDVAAEVPAEADLDNDEGAQFPIERGRIGGGSVWDPSCMDEIRWCAMSGFGHHLGLSKGKDPIRHEVGCRCALSVSDGGGETPMVVSGVQDTTQLTN
jgi:hypothetical protein